MNPDSKVVKGNLNAYNNTSSNSINISSNNNNSDELEDYLNFIFEKNNRKCFISVNGNDKFVEVIWKLEEKYNWFKDNQNQTYYYQSKVINNKNLSLDELGIVDGSDIIVKQ